MRERREQILQKAIEMIADEGYGSLTMRALARVNGMKLGALQYHFRTSQEMWQALVSYVGESYRYTFGRLRNDDAPPTIREIVLFILDDDAGDAIAGDRLWPQFWAMQHG